MTTTTPTPALADLDTLTRYGWSEAYIGEESQLIEDPSGTYVRFEDVQALARRAAQPVAPVRIDTAVEAMLCDHTKLNEDGLDKYVPQIVALLNHVAVLPAPAEFATPSPQIAEVAELPPLPKAYQKGWIYTTEQMQQYARDAIAASRRAATEPIAIVKDNGDGWDAHMTAHGYRLCGNGLSDGAPLYLAAPASAGQAERECGDCEGTGRISPVELCARCKESGVLPGSAGQAGPTYPDPYMACLSVACSFAHDSIERHAAMICVRAVQESIATQPAEVSAGQAGQVTCAENCFWGDCPPCVRSERAAVPADHEIREAVNQLRDLAVQFHAHQSLRDRIASVVLPLVRGATQQPSTGGQDA